MASGPPGDAREPAMSDGSATRVPPASSPEPSAAAGCHPGVDPDAQTPAFRTLLYRYFFFGWLFMDVSRGSLLERAAAWRHNRQQARWLPTYMRRWLWCGIVLYGFGGLVELALGSPTLSAFFYVPSALSVPINAVIGAAWLGLKTIPRPF